MSFAFFPSLVRISSSSPIYLFLFWISWVPGGHSLSHLPHFFGWNSIERVLAMGSYCSNFRVIRASLARIPPLYHSFDLLTLAQSCVLPLGPIVILVCTKGEDPLRSLSQDGPVGDPVVVPPWSIEPLQRIIHPRLAKARGRLVRLGTLVVTNI